MFTKKQLSCLILSSGTIFVSTISSPLLAEDKVNPIYAKVGAGMISTSEIDAEEEGIKGTLESDDNTWNLNFGLGKEIGNYRVEGSYNQNQIKLDSISVGGIKFSYSPEIEIDVKYYQLNVLRDFNKGEKFSPYVGVGVGFASINVDDQSDVELVAQGVREDAAIENEDDSAFSYSLTGGVSYNINKSASFYTEATYIKTTKIELGVLDLDDLSQTLIAGGLRYRF